MSLKCAMVGLEVEHKEANRSVLSFLEVGVRHTVWRGRAAPSHI